MIVPRRKFSVDDKVKILREAGEEGVTVVLNKYHLSYSVYVKWKHKFHNAELHMQDIQNFEHVQQHLKVLQEENIMLKKIIADRALLLSMKEEELKMIATA